MMDLTGAQSTRTSRVTPLLQILQFIAPLGLLIVTLGLSPVLGIAAGILIGAIAVVLYLSWMKLTFKIVHKIGRSPELIVESGVFIRRTRSLRISRLQSVDIHRPLIARLTGFASVQVEVAGTGDSRVLLKYLSLLDAQEFRLTILRLAANNSSKQQSAAEAEDLRQENQHPQDNQDRPDWTGDYGTGDYGTGAHPPLPIRKWEVSNKQLAASLVLTTSTYVLIGGAIFSTFMVLINGAGGLTAIAFALIVSAVTVLTGFTTLFNFTLTKTDQGVSISHGLLSTSSYTISPIRLQALEISQPIAWRMFGWHRISINVAGIDNDQKTSGPRVLIPVIHQSELNELFSALLPEWCIDLSAHWEPVDSRAKWRYPLQFRYIGISISPETFMTRTGWLTRRVKIAPHARIQSLSITQGPIQKRLNIATLQCDSVPGPIHIRTPGVSSYQACTTAKSEVELMHLAISNVQAEQWTNLS